MIDIGLSIALLLTIIWFRSEVNNLCSKLNKPKRGRGRPRKEVNLQLSRPGGIMK